MESVIEKQDENSVKVTRTVVVEEVIDYETLIAKRAGLVKEKADYIASTNVSLASLDRALAEVDEALGKGISAKPELVKEPT